MSKRELINELKIKLVELQKNIDALISEYEHPNTPIVLKSIVNQSIILIEQLNLSEGQVGYLIQQKALFSLDDVCKSFSSYDYQTDNHFLCLIDMSAKTYAAIDSFVMAI